MSFTHTNFKNFSVHTYTAPETGYQVNTQIIETEKHLVIIDTQFLIKSAEEVFNFVKKIGKPIARVIVTHAHPEILSLLAMIFMLFLKPKKIWKKML